MNLNARLSQQTIQELTTQLGGIFQQAFTQGVNSALSSIDFSKLNLGQVASSTMDDAQTGAAGRCESEGR